MDPTELQVHSLPLRRRRRLTRERRITWLALLASALFHIGVLLLVPPFIEPDGDPESTVQSVPAEIPEFGIEVIQSPAQVARETAIGRPDAPAPGSPAPVAPAPVPPQPVVVVDATIVGEGEVEAVDPIPTVAERLRPRMVDPRLWAPVELVGANLTDEERAQLLLSGMIRNWNDSMAIALALSDRATDWTYTDDQGRRWGLSPGRLHLGDFSIPLPFSFGGSMEQSMLRRRELEDLEWIRQDLERARIQGEIREVWAERARAIRERMEAERRDAESEADGP